MVVNSAYTIDIPQCSFVDLVFGPPQAELSSSEPLLLDYARPQSHFLTRHTFRVWSQRLGGGMTAAGLQKGDRVMVVSGNRLFYSVAFMGVIMAGGIFTGCNPAYSPHELAHQMRDCDPKFILSQGGSTLQTCLEAARMVGRGHKKRTFVFDDRVFDSVEQPDEQGCPYWSKLMLFDTEVERFAWDSLTGPDEARKTTLALNYSSGTTGLSKGVEITHGNYVANVVQYNHLMAHNRDYDAKHRQNERYLCFLPLYHAMAQMLFLGVAQIRHAPVYIMEKFDFLGVLQSVEIYRISDLLIVPPVAVMLAKRPETKNFDLSSVRYIGSGAAPLSRELSQEVEDLWPKGTINIKQGWGMTELTCALLGWEHTKTSYSNSVGWPLPNSQAKIMSLPDEAADSDNLLLRKELGPNEPGELWVRGPQVMKGYWKNPKATADTMTPDGWVRTGDIAYYDNEQKFFISGRLKELIKVKGLQVPPTELDGACLECKEVADAAVVGVTINDQEHPRAYIVLREGTCATNETAQSIAVQVNAKLSHHKRITGGIVFTDSIPKNPSGKILRRLLRERAQNEVHMEQMHNKTKAFL